MSDNADRVTTLVANYITNEGDVDPGGGGRIAEIAADFADKEDVAEVRRYVVGIIRTHQSRFTEEVRNALSADDWAEIDWNEVTRQLKSD